MPRDDPIPNIAGRMHSSIGQEYGSGMVYSESAIESYLSPRLGLWRVYLFDWLPRFIVERLALALATEDEGFAVGEDCGVGKYTLMTRGGKLFRFQNGGRFYFPKLYFKCVAGGFLLVIAKAGSCEKRNGSRLFLFCPTTMTKTTKYTGRDKYS